VIPFQMHLANFPSAMKRAGTNPVLLLEASCYSDLLFSEAIVQSTTEKSLQEALTVLTASYILETH